MSRSATAKRKRQARKAINAILPEAREPINISEASFKRRMARKQQASNGPQSLSMAWDDNSLGVNSTQTREGLLDERERKDTYYKVFIGNQVVSGCCNVISKRITSGGWECVEVEQGKGNLENKAKIEALLRFENLEEDFQQFLRSIAVDILVFGEAYCELVWSGGMVVGLYVIDAISMTTMFDQHGNVIKYVQRMEKSTQTIDFEPDQIIRWWLPDPRAKKKALSPIEHLKDPVYLDQSMMTFVEKFFKQGARFGYSVELGDDTGPEEAARYAKFFRENYTGVQNSHVPPIVYGGGKIVESGKGSVDIDFDKGQDKQRDRVLMVYGVPPAELNIIESGNLGSGKGDAQNKSFTYNTVMPIKQIILEKFNYRVIKKGLGIEDWVVDTRLADYRSDDEISKIEDTSIRNGTLLINEGRSDRGRKPIPGGDEAVIITTREVTPVQRLTDLADEQAQTAQLGIETQQAQVEKLKNPPPPPPQLVAPGQPPDGKQPPQNGAKGQQPPQQKGNQQQDDEEQDKAKESAQEYIEAWQDLIDTIGVSNVLKSIAILDKVKERHAQQRTEETRQEALVQGIAQSRESRSSHTRDASSRSADTRTDILWSGSQKYDAKEAVINQGPIELACSDGTSGRDDRDGRSGNSSAITSGGIGYADAQARNASPQEDGDAQAQEAYSTQDSSPREETSRDTSSGTPQEVMHWQASDPGIQKQLEELKEKGITSLGPWECHPSACDECLQNQGQIVKLGEAFKSGCFVAPSHNHCECTYKENYE
jgi:HK97 family phage portal protein